MKKLEELGISPAPWSFADDGTGACDIRCSGVPYGEDYEGDGIIAQSVQKKDAAMLTAAPKLYSKAWELLAAFDARVMTPGHVEALRAALAEAAGEATDS